MLPLDSAILLTFIKLPFVIKIFVLSIFEGPFYTGFTVLIYHVNKYQNAMMPLVGILTFMSRINFMLLSMKKFF